MAEKRGISEKIAELDRLSEWFYSDDFRLEEATAKYKEAMKLAKEIESDLAEMKNEIEVLAEDFSK
ncbi:exodeoxyribonuclease VII small subunit [Candidatus Saccharibacteria bacterium]|nr:exodeoxyribonuclease VII small subunit [Candidatus Saccharibacteria bacterium]